MTLKSLFPLILVLTAFNAAPPVGRAQQPSGGPLDITADSLEYLSDQDLMVGRGNVQVRDGLNYLKADYMTVDTTTMEVKAQGNVQYKSGEEVWEGDAFTYNLRTKEGDFGDFSGFYDPFYITADTTRRVSTNEIYFTGVTLTTCEGDDPAVSIRAREAQVVDNRLTARGVVFYAANVIPYFYMPKYSRSLGSHERFFQYVPGYNSRHGVFLLTAYNYPLFGNVRGITHVDVRTKRGIGFGQDFKWEDPEGTYEGIVQGYYLQDDDPLRGPDSENRNEDNIDEERYRLRLAHNQRFSPRDTLLGELNYLSDPFILQDFFDAEYRYNVQPENRLTLTHRGDRYTAAIQFNMRLNDFYENVNRMPELSLDLPRQRLFESDFYYESRSTASQLERVFPEDSDREDYDAYRIDSSHTIFYPTRNFGFLNLIPRAGYRATYYSETFSNESVTNTVLVTDESGNPVTNDSGFVSFTNITETVSREEGADIRHVFQLGWEGSFKAYKTWDDYVILGDGDGVRHIVEPYLDHTYVPKPNLTPDELPQFDSVDRVNERHDIKLGVRNKIQTRRNASPVDLIDLNLYTFYRIEKQEDQEDFSTLNMDADIRLLQWMPIEIDGTYDMYESEIETFNTEIGVLMSDDSRINIEHRYRKDRQNLLGANLDLFPNASWAFELGARYDFEGSELEEHYYIVKNTRPCVSWGVGFRQIDEDEQIWVQFWLTAFPELLIDLGYK